MLSWHLLTSILCWSGHMMAFFYAHHIFTWQPKGGGGGGGGGVGGLNPLNRLDPPLHFGLVLLLDIDLLVEVHNLLVF